MRLIYRCPRHGEVYRPVRRDEIKRLLDRTLAAVCGKCLEYTQLYDFDIDLTTKFAGKYGGKCY